MRMASCFYPIGVAEVDVGSFDGAYRDYKSSVHVEQESFDIQLIISHDEGCRCLVKWMEQSRAVKLES